MRVAFLGTGEIAIPAFRRLIERGSCPVLLVTQPDKPVGRHHTLTPPAIKTIAIETGIPVLQPERIRDIQDELAAYELDLVVVMAYGQILSTKFIALPSLACINLHASLLPRHRGAACIQAAIAQGDAETGISVMHVVRALDAGDVILSKAIPIHPDETGGQLHDRLAELAPDAMSEAIGLIISGNAPRTPQDESQVTYISKFERDDGQLDFTRPATELERIIRAYDPWPGTFMNVLENGKPRRLKVFPPTQIIEQQLAPDVIEITDGEMIVGCAVGALKLQVVQPEGSKRMAVAEYLRGRLPVGKDYP
ncbi:MAG: methionyl-tRNA formyltransferase [Verrucomicrobiales bacterium]